MVEHIAGGEKSARPRGYWLRVGGLLMVAGLVTDHTTPQQHPAKHHVARATHGTAPSRTPTSVKAPALHEKQTNPLDNVGGLRNFESFQQHETVQRKTIEQSYRSVVQLESSVGMCTGSVINTYLVTAGHCASDEAKITLGSDYTGRISKQVRDVLPLTDLLVATTTEKQLPTLTIPTFANDTPLPGSRLITTSYPAGSDKPILGSLTFLYEQPPQDSDLEMLRVGRKWVLAVGPDNSNDAQQALCDPGASGSTVLDSHGHVGVLTESTSRYYEDRGEWEKAQRFYETMSGVNLDTASAVCLATPLDRTTFDTYVHTLDAA